MANNIAYFITGVWKDQTKRIVSVYLHRNAYDTIKNSNSFSSGIKTPEQDVIRLLKQGLLIKTLLWNYPDAIWQQGAFVEVVKVGTSEFLRTHKDAKTSDNLDNMINMAGFI